MICNSVVVMSVRWPRRILSRRNNPFLWSKMKNFPYKILFFYLFFFFFCIISPAGNHHFLPTSPLRDYGVSQGNKHQRSRSASVRFVSEADNVEQVQSTHGSCCSKQAVCLLFESPRVSKTLCFYIKWGDSEDAAKNASVIICAFNVTWFFH